MNERKKERNIGKTGVQTQRGIERKKERKKEGLKKERRITEGKKEL